MARMVGSIWLVLALAALPGCKHLRREQEQPPAEVMEGRPVQRTRIDPEAHVLPVPLQTRPDDRLYWGMTPQETQCRAAEKSGTAELMQKEHESLEEQHCLNRNSKNTRMKQTMLRHSSVEARDVAAGTAM